MKTSVFFTLELSTTDESDVTITIESNSYKMRNILARNKKKYFQFQFILDDSLNYPFQIPYSYSFDDNLQRMVIIKKKSFKDIYVKDSNLIRPESVNFHTVTFFLRVKCQTNSQILLVSPTKCFWKDNKPQNQIQMDLLHSGVFKCTVLIPADTFAPISYKYFVTSPIRIDEVGRSHILFIDSPIGGKIISVYDSFNENNSLLPVFPRPFDPSDCDMFHTHLSLDIAPSKQMKFVHLSFENEEESFEPLKKEFVWNFDKKYARLAGKKIHITYQTNEKNKNSHSESEKLQIDDTRNKIDFVAIRNIQGSVNERSVGVYFDLLSIPLTNTSPCGSFSSLERIVDWAKESGICHLHVGIERINDNRLIDPALANIDLNDTPRGTPLGEIREKKIEVLKGMYEEWEQRGKTDISFIEFKKGIGKFIAPLCLSPFAFYVQYVLYKELVHASVYAMKCGIALVMDVICDDTPGSLDHQIQILSTCASYLKIMNASSVLAPISFKDVVSIFGNTTPSVSNAIEIIGTAVFIKKEYSKDSDAASICKIQPEMYSDFAMKFNKLSALASSQERIARAQQFFQFFKSIANITPSAVLLDEAATLLLKEDALIQFNILPSNHNYFYEPSFLSPEVFSEFSSSIPEKEVKTKIKDKLLSPSKCVTLYLGDLLCALGLGRIPGEKINNEKHHIRFTLNISAKELSEDHEFSKNVMAYLSEFNSLAQ